MYSCISEETHLYSSCRPVNKEELFNLHHASACHIIKQIFGVLKWHFRILLLAPEYSLEIQVQIPAALTAIHNFICTYDTNGDNTSHKTHNNFNKDSGPTFAHDNDNVDEQWDWIAQAMWDDYWQVCMERGIDADGPAGSDNDDDELDAMTCNKPLEIPSICRSTYILY
jgi:hypothetical protein